jgi:hypothetical protein
LRRRGGVSDYLPFPRRRKETVNGESEMMIDAVVRSPAEGGGEFATLGLNHAAFSSPRFQTNSAAGSRFYRTFRARARR